MAVDRIYLGIVFVAVLAPQIMEEINNLAIFASSMRYLKTTSYMGLAICIMDSCSVVQGGYRQHL